MFYLGGKYRCGLTFPAPQVKAGSVMADYTVGGTGARTYFVLSVSGNNFVVTSFHTDSSVSGGVWYIYGR